MSRGGAQVQAGPGCGSLIPSAGAPFRKLIHASAAGPPRPHPPGPAHGHPEPALKTNSGWVPLLSRQPLIAHIIHCSHCPQSLVLPKDQSHTWSRSEKDSSVTEAGGPGGKQGFAGWVGEWIVVLLSKHKGSRSKNAL